ncbi:MAG: MarR family transcriptional regulator [Prochloraceae cyanobacterium]|nr:MarR family transcriptional regulator [Prochloraceae cyanobacterium]
MKENQFLKLTHRDWIETTKGLTGAEIKVLFYLKTLNPFADKEINISVTEIAKDLELSKGTVSKALKRLDQIKLLPDWFETSENNTVEHDVRARLHEQLGGLIEVAIPAGRIDLLTNTEIITENFDDRTTKPTKPTPQTYRKFIQGLSEEEREKFFNFVRQKTKNFNPAIVNINDYLASKDRWQDFYREFRNVVQNKPKERQKRLNSLAARIDRRKQEL